MTNNYPYTDFHELNLNWILSKVKELESASGVTEERVLEIVTEFFTEHRAELIGPQGPAGADYVITSADYAAIATIVLGMLTVAETQEV